MNRGEGLRIAAKNKSGSTIGHMFQDTKTKPKKFGYKSKTQSFPVRRNIQGANDEGNQQLSKTAGSKPQQKTTNKQNGNANRQVFNPKNATKAVNHNDKAKSSFIDKNKKVLSKKEKIMKQADTVTLTQDQLNAILKTIGTAGESAGAPSFSIDAGQLKVNLSSINKENDNTESEKAKERHGDESTSAMINRTQNDFGDPVSTGNQDSNNNSQTHGYDAPIEKTQELPSTAAPVQNQSPRMGQSDILNTIGMSDQNDRSLMEKKKQQWKQDLDAQLAAKKAVQDREGRGRRGRSQIADNSEGWNPWGQPGGGAPMRSSVDASSPRDNRVVNAAHPSPGRSSRGPGLNDMVSQSISGVSHMDGQRFVPAAMRSSFAIGGMGNDHNADLKRKEQQQWLHDLERQKREAKEKKDQEKASQCAVESAVMQHWADPVDPPPARMISRMDNKVAQVQDDSRVLSRVAAERKQETRETDQPKSRMEMQRNVPAAMRSSFAIGGMGNEHNADLKRKEQQQWLQDLERQKREAKEKKDQEKASQRAVESAVMQHWAEPVDPPPARMISRMDNKVAQVQDDSHVLSRVAAERKQETRETDQPKSAPHNSSRSPHTTEDDSPRMHIRPANTLIDPAEMERREMQKKRQLEHMAFVQAQVEEKQRKKREALTLRRQEEAEEERKLAEERDRLAHDFEREQDKLRKKEEAAAAKQRAMAESMQNAHDAAKREKHAERMRKLQRQGHDVTNLRKSWDAQHESPEASPRLPAQATGSHLQPPLKPTASIAFSPRQEPVPSVAVAQSDFQGNGTNTLPPHIRDAATSPVNEVSTQTEMDVLDANYISPRLIAAIRLASEGAEYKPKSKKRTDQEKSKQLAEGGRKKDKAVKVVSIKEETEENKNSKSRRNSNASKPKWGQTAQAKKVMKNSDKDMSMSKRKREERLKKRQEELLALQEKSAPKRVSQPKQTKVDNEKQGRKSRADTKLSHHSDEHKVSRAGSRREAHALTQERVMSQQQSRKEFRPSSSEDSYNTQTPPFKNNDFVPFMRTEDDELNEGSLSISPAPAPIPPRPIPNKNDTSMRGETSRASRHSRQSHREMDPLLNPDRLKDKELRQEEILIQLSTLRQGLLMKQRELEIGLPPGSPVIM